ncbi:MAG TPA: glycosyltransferase family 4 protein [Polymorphobacter sp.]|nr:glycosyltransferase family 4 protein [Polymorphobacter sp.]
MQPARPKITHVVRQFWPQKGGLEESVRQLCVTLRQNHDADVSVVTLDRTFSDGQSHPAVEIVEGIPVRRLGYHGSNRYPVAPGFLDATAGSDLIHVHAIDFFFDALALARPFRGIPMVASTHGGFFHTSFASKLKSMYFATVTRAACRAYAVIGASSEGDVALFRSIAGSRVEVIENGVDIEKWAGAASPVYVPTMIAIGRWSSNKNMEGMFALLAELRRTDPAWRLVIAGNPYDVSRADLERWAAAHDASAAVEIHAGPSTEELAGLIGAASFFISLSDYEGFGLAAIEGLSAGLVPILSDIVNYRIFVERAGVGAVVAADPMVAAMQVRALAADVAADAGRCRTAAMAGAARYSWAGVAARWQQVYASVLGQQPGFGRGDIGQAA